MNKGGTNSLFKNWHTKGLPLGLKPHQPLKAVGTTKTRARLVGFAAGGAAGARPIDYSFDQNFSAIRRAKIIKSDDRNPRKKYCNLMWFWIVYGRILMTRTKRI